MGKQAMWGLVGPILSKLVMLEGFEQRSVIFYQNLFCLSFSERRSRSSIGSRQQNDENH